MRRAVSFLATGLFLAAAALHAQAAPLAHRETKKTANMETTVYVPKNARACAECDNCPTLAPGKAQDVCVRKFCSRCPDHIVFGACTRKGSRSQIAVASLWPDCWYSLITRNQHPHHHQQRPSSPSPPAWVATTSSS